MDVVSQEQVCTVKLAWWRSEGTIKSVLEKQMSLYGGFPSAVEALAQAGPG